MKKLRYIKLYEAFESNVLNKTIGYINKNSRKKFLDALKNICNYLDYPYSKLSDEYFEYLPFNKALSKFVDANSPEECVNDSEREFGGSGVPGAKCKNGKILRKWGKGTREVVCPKCKGTGIKEERKKELNLIKFWFDIDGNYITQTAVDGRIRASNKNLSETKITSTGIDDTDYDVGSKVYRFSNLSELSHGDKIRLELGRHVGEHVNATLFKHNHRCYAIQDSHSGNSPSCERSEWTKYGKYSWVLGCETDFSDLRLLIPKDKLPSDEVDPYTLNCMLSIGRGSVSINSSNIYDYVKDAHFAIIMSYDKLNTRSSQSDFISRSTITSNRADLKSGILGDNESIRTANLKRYIDVISRKLNIVNDIESSKRLVLKSIGNKMALYLITNYNIANDLMYLIEFYLKLLNSNDEVQQKMYIDYINNRTESLIRLSHRRSDIISNRIKEVKKLTDSDVKTRNKNEVSDIKEMLSLMDDLSTSIYDVFDKMEINTIEDLEISTQKISSIRNILKSDRYNLNSLSYYIGNIIYDVSNDELYRYISDKYYSDPSKIIPALKRVIGIIKRM